MRKIKKHHTLWTVQKLKKILFAKDYSAFEDINTENYIKVYTDNGFIYINDNGSIKKVINVCDIPITFNGLIECNIENSLAAVAALYGINTPLSVIEKGLRTFEKNEGRFNFYRHKDFKILLDYGHNLPGIDQVIKACNCIGYSRLIGIIGMPGDRNEEAIRKVGKLCSKAFNNIYIKEDTDTRGRKQSEVANIFYKEILSNDFNKQNVKIILNEHDALKEAVENGREGDLIVVFYEKLAPLVDYLNTINAETEYLN